MKVVKNDKKNNKISTTIGILLLVAFSLIFIISLIKIGIYFVSANNTHEIVKTLDDFIAISGESEDDIEIDFAKLKEVNPDTVGWIRVNNTNINYPVVKGTNNDYYLKRDFKKKWNEGGWIYADYHNNVDGNDKNLVIFGHAMKNKTMFGSLLNTLDSNWNKDETNLKIYRHFGFVHYVNTQFDTDEEYKDFINNVKDRSIYKYKEDVSSTTNILTLSTCYDNNDTRLVVHAYLIDVK